MRADAGRPDVAARGRSRRPAPFCGDHGPGKYHLSLNTSTDQYRCNLCGARGNSVTLYARLHGIGNKEAYRALAEGSKIYPMPHPPASPKTERQPLALAQRHAAYTTMLEHLVLLDQHRENLLEQGALRGTHPAKPIPQHAGNGTGEAASRRPSSAPADRSFRGSPASVPAMESGRSAAPKVF